MVTITTQSQADAVSVERELAPFGASAAAMPHGWEVTVVEAGDVRPVLTALKRCLGANAIPAVNVTIAGRTYLLADAP
jgi:hypothetical protein